MYSQRLFGSIAITALLFTLSSTTEVLIIQDSEQFAFQSKELCNYKFLAGMGDSYAAGIKSGEQLPNCTTKPYDPADPTCTIPTCYKNKGAYPYLFYEKYKSNIPKWQFLACSGADSNDIATIQYPVLDASADLVTINVGGNNGNAFSQVVTRCVYLPTKVAHELFCPPALANAAKSIESIDAALLKLFSEIKSKTKSATIVVLGYIRFWPENPEKCQSGPLDRPTAGEKTLMNSLVSQLNAKLHAAASSNGAIFIDPNSFFEGHRFCDIGEPYMQYKLFEDGDGDDDDIDDPYMDWYNRGVFHPTEKGQQMYLESLLKRLGC